MKGVVSNESNTSVDAPNLPSNAEINNLDDVGNRTWVDVDSCDLIHPSEVTSNIAATAIQNSASVGCISQPENINADHADEAEVTFSDELDGCCCTSYCHRLFKPSKSTTRALCERTQPTNCLKLRELFSWIDYPFWTFLFNCRLKRRVRQRLPNENFLVLSIIQMLCGFASIILSSVALTKAVFLYRMATGMWVGFLMLITGCQGLLTARRPITGTLVGLLVLCIITTLASCLLIGVSVAGAIEDGFLDQNRGRSRSVHQVIRLIFSYMDDESPFKTGYPHADRPTSVNWTSINHPRVKSISPVFRPGMSDSHLRTCQVILHVLLLLVGILNCSVSLSTSVLCGRLVCSRSRRLANNANSYVNRTNIVSFDNATASQAVNLLQSCNVRQFIGSGNVLLAVAPDSLRRHETELVRSNSNYSRPNPRLHHTVSSFLPESNRSALILTQAGTGALAWTAAHAAASVLEQNQSQRRTSIQNESLPNRPSESIPRRLRLRLKRQRRPRLLFTSLNLDSARHLSAPPYPSSSTMLYVMPSPNTEDPPLIFPPFPPPYSPLQKRPSISVFSRPQEAQVNHRRNRRPPRQIISDTSLAVRNSSANLLSSIFTRHFSNRHLISRNRRRNTRPRVTRSRAATSTLMCAVDRILQPVLIIEDPEQHLPNRSVQAPNPPAYNDLYPDDLRQSNPTNM